jgi:putative transposase
MYAELAHEEVDTSLRSARLVRIFERHRDERGLPDLLRVDDGAEFLGQAFFDCGARPMVC